jgi:hypothetical protein
MNSVMTLIAAEPDNILPLALPKRQDGRALAFDFLRRFLAIFSLGSFYARKAEPRKPAKRADLIEVKHRR